MKQRTAKRFMVLFIVLPVLMATTPAFAQDSTLRGYDEQDVAVVDRGEGEVPAGEEEAVEGGGGLLPITGADLALLAAGGGGLLVLGLGMRRLTRKPSPT